jgi:hypothetical protein
MLDHYCGKSLKHLQLLQPNDPAVAAGVWEVVAAAAAGNHHIILMSIQSIVPVIPNTQIRYKWRENPQMRKGHQRFLFLI